MSNDISISASRTGGLTTLDITRSLESDPREAAALGTYLQAQQTVREETRSLGSFDVQGDTESVNYQGRNADIVSNMQRGPTMVAGAEYAISAGGTIDKNGWGWGGDVSPDDRTSDGRTRLQVAVVRDGQVLRTEDYRPDSDGQMRINTKKGEEGASLGFYMLDGVDASERADNDGSFKVSVDETRTISATTAIAVQAQDAEGIVRAGQQVAQAFETAPEAAYLPEPDPSYGSCPAGRGIVKDPLENTAETTDGYAFQFRENQISIYSPDRNDPVTVIDGRTVRESDGTTWKAEDGNFIAPNGALLHLEFDGDQIRKAELIHGDSRMTVDGAGYGDGAVSLRPVEGGGLDRRAQLVEDFTLDSTYRMGGAHDRLDDLDVTWSVEQRGQDLGIIASGHDARNGQTAIERIPYFVAPELRPPFGTPDHERMLQSEILDQRSILSGLGQASGASPEEARLVADYLLGPASGQFQEYAQQIQASQNARSGQAGVDPRLAQQLMQQYQQQLMMQQLLGGLPPYFQDFPEAMAAIQQLMQVLSGQASMRNDYQAGASNLRSYIPSVGAAQQGQGQGQGQVSVDQLVDQALRGLQNRNTRNPLERFDLNSGGSNYAARRTGRDPGANLIARRMAETTAGGSKPTAREIETRATQLAMGIYEAIDGPGTNNEQLINLLSKASPEERQALKTVYPKMYGESIEDAIRGDTSFNYENAAIGLLNNTSDPKNPVVDDARATQDAAAINDAIRSDWYNPGTWGTDEDKLSNILTNRSPAEIKRISEIYEASYGESLRDAITGDTSGNYQATLLAQLDQAEGAKPVVVQARPHEVEANQAALAINNAVHGAGTDNQKLIDVLSSLSNEGKAELKAIYPKLYGESLDDAIKGDTNDHWDLDFQNTLLALANNPRSTARTGDELKATQDAARFRAAITTWSGTDEATLDELLTTRSPAEIQQMARVYQATYGETLEQAIEGDTSGWSKDALLHQLTLR